MSRGAVARISPAAEDRRIRALRGPRERVDPFRPLGVVRERERVSGGEIVDSLAVFLAGRECPFTCVFCDLWRRTLEGPTPPGAIPRQLEMALAEAGPLPATARIKLYNASNFFDPLAVPVEDEPAIARLVEPFARVVVECHPRLVGERCFRFAERLGEGRLEVAMGLETADPEALARLNKRMTLDDFDRAAEALRRRRIGLRAFVLLGVPFVAPERQVEVAVRSVRYALDRGAHVVSLIPLRGADRENGEMGRLAAAGELEPPTLAQLEESFDRALERAGAGGADEGVVQVDAWDLERLGGCAACAEERRARLLRMNLSGAGEPRVACERCGDAA